MPYQYKLLFAMVLSSAALGASMDHRGPNDSSVRHALQSCRAMVYQKLPQKDKSAFDQLCQQISLTMKKLKSQNHKLMADIEQMNQGCHDLLVQQQRDRSDEISKLQAQKERSIKTIHQLREELEGKNQELDKYRQLEEALGSFLDSQSSADDAFMWDLVLDHDGLIEKQKVIQMLGIFGKKANELKQQIQELQEQNEFLHFALQLQKQQNVSSSAPVSPVAKKPCK